MDLTVDPTSAVPPYEQLRSRIAAMAADGSLAAGTRLPTVRGLAGDLGVAAGTVARAYRELEADGVVATEGRRGTFVRSGVLARDSDRSVPAREAAEQYVTAARRLGLTAGEATALVERAWTEHA